MKFDSIVIVKKLDDRESDRVKEIVKVVESLADTFNMPVCSENETNFITPNSLFVAIGGDGTMIYAMKEAAKHNAYVLGVNIGKLGFLNDFPPEREKLYASLGFDLFTGGALPVEKSMLLRTTVNDKTFASVNELTIAHAESDTILNFDLFVDGCFAGNHRANSVVISTPTGSTAYALSAGGAVLHPSMEAIEIVPVAPLRMASRPIVVSGKSMISIVAKSAKNMPTVIRSDGQKAFVQEGNESETEVIIRADEHKVKMFHSDKWNFFDILSSKMGWLS